MTSLTSKLATCSFVLISLIIKSAWGGCSVLTMDLDGEDLIESLPLQLNRGLTPPWLATARLNRRNTMIFILTNLSWLGLCGWVGVEIILLKKWRMNSSGISGRRK